MVVIWSALRFTVGTAEIILAWMSCPLPVVKNSSNLKASSGCFVFLPIPIGRYAAGDMFPALPAGIGTISHLNLAFLLYSAQSHGPVILMAALPLRNRLDNPCDCALVGWTLYLFI